MKFQLVLARIIVKKQHGAQMKKCVQQGLKLPLVLVNSHLLVLHLSTLEKLGKILFHVLKVKSVPKQQIVI